MNRAHHFVAEDGLRPLGLVVMPLWLRPGSVLRAPIVDKGVCQSVAGHPMASDRAVNTSSCLSRNLSLSRSASIVSIFSPGSPTAALANVVLKKSVADSESVFRTHTRVT